MPRVVAGVEVEDLLAAEGEQRRARVERRAAGAGQEVGVEQRIGEERRAERGAHARSWPLPKNRLSVSSDAATTFFTAS